MAEVRSMANPPAIVKLALESICLLLDASETTDWKTIRSTLNKDSFIPSIINFDTLSLTYDIPNVICFFFYILLFQLDIYCNCAFNNIIKPTTYYARGMLYNDVFLSQPLCQLNFFNKKIFILLKGAVNNTIKKNHHNKKKITNLYAISQLSTHTHTYYTTSHFY